MCPIDDGQRTLFDDEEHSVITYDDAESDVPALPSANAALDSGDGYDYDEPEEA